MLTAFDLAVRLGLRRHARSWRGRCPACAYAGETFSLRELRGRPVLFCANGCDRVALRDALIRIMGAPWWRSEQSEARDEAARRAHNQQRALALWTGSEPATGTLADVYLTARGLPGLSASAALRFRADTPHPERARLPAMIALVQDVNGAPVAVHRTYLRRDGAVKATVVPDKASIGPVWGGAIRLDPLAPELAIAEGVETSASAGRLLGLPAWSAVSSGNLGRGAILPPDVRSVVIAADPDESGQKAAREAWRRWTAEGRRVRIATPDGAGDFNDLLRGREVVHA